MTVSIPSAAVRCAALAFALGAVACADHSQGPTSENLESRPEQRKTSIDPGDRRASAEALARALALALRDPELRSHLKADLDASPIREHKLHFQRYLTGGAKAVLGQVARASGVAAATLQTAAAQAGGLELYLPVPAHRAAWSGDERVLVATAQKDHDPPVAFDLQGRRQVLSPDAPPTTPVLALVPVETDFDAPVRTAEIIVCPNAVGVGVQCGSGGGGSGPLGGLWMKAATFTETFEGWLKGSPEFETHILGQAGTTDSLTDYQCTGEKQAAPYYYDQNATTWTGSVLLFSQSQINAYKTAHPTNSMRVVVVEDDDTACKLKMDAGRFRAALNLVDSTYRQLTAGRDTTVGLTRIWSRAKAFQKVLQAIWSFITTQDDYVGTAVQDVVAGEFWPGANWIVKGENNLTKGALQLEMR
jgi:hypothetical protein